MKKYNKSNQKSVNNLNFNQIAKILISTIIIYKFQQIGNHNNYSSNNLSNNSIINNNNKFIKDLLLILHVKYK